MRIDAIIQSTGYHDMLALTLPLNKVHFDSVTVYTKRGDEETKKVCAREGVGCVETDRFSQGGSSFNRGAVYNEALYRLLIQGEDAEGRSLYKPDRMETIQQFIDRSVGWICVIDSDIVLPNTCREVLESSQLDPEMFYGARRYNVETYEQWLAVRANPDTLKRLTLYRGYGYGYLQLFHCSSSTFRTLDRQTKMNPYPEWKDGSTADWMFRNAWGDHPWNPPTQPPKHELDHSVPEPCDEPTGKLRKLPFNVIHLGITGINSTGRHTPLWTDPSA